MIQTQIHCILNVVNLLLGDYGLHTLYKNKWVVVVMVYYWFHMVTTLWVLVVVDHMIMSTIFNLRENTVEQLWS